MKHVQCRNKREYKAYRDELIDSEELRSTLVLTFPDKTRQVFSGITASDRDDLLDALTADVKKAVVFSSVETGGNMDGFAWRPVEWDGADTIERFELDVSYLRTFADHLFNQENVFAPSGLGFLDYQGYATLLAMLSNKTVCLVGARTDGNNQYALYEGLAEGRRYLQDHGDPAYRHYFMQLTHHPNGSIQFEANPDARVTQNATPDPSTSNANSKEGA